MDSLLDFLSKLVKDYVYLAPIISLIAGILTSFLPLLIADDSNYNWVFVGE
ncbi:hypothetical protein ACF3OI_01995 [Finegoldia magna]|uniref:hypothetical protein n=1 Tax=Finegoldia magna TaxID=1260 RepID=UPI00370DC9FC